MTGAIKKTRRQEKNVITKIAEERLPRLWIVEECVVNLEGGMRGEREKKEKEKRRREKKEGTYRVQDRVGH